MKLYILNCGQMITPDGNILAEFNTDLLRLVLPVPAFLLDHPAQGLVLLDTGFCYDHLTNEMKAGMTSAPHQQLRRQIAALGYDPDKVRHIVLSHLHFDHAGQLGEFPQAAVHLRRAEWESAQNPPTPDYFPQDYVCLRNRQLDLLPNEEDIDLFGDGSLLCLDTKGHSAGHQSFLVTLPQTGRMLLAVDAAHLPAYFETDRFFAESYDPAGCVAAAKRIRQMAADCQYMVMGHDPAMWRTVRPAPFAYM